jgi:hypothetical protein
MSLNYDLTEVEDYEGKCYEGEGDNLRLHPETQMLVFLTMTIGMGTITKKNWREFAARAVLANFAWPTGMTRGEMENLVRSHIGLSTNVGKTTRSKFMRLLEDKLVRDTTRPEVA